MLVTGQALLLLLPIYIGERRLPTRRPLKFPVVVTAFFLANLVFSGMLSILCADFKEDGFNFSVTSCRSSPTRCRPPTLKPNLEM